MSSAKSFDLKRFQSSVLRAATCHGSKQQNLNGGTPNASLEIGVLRSQSLARKGPSELTGGQFDEPKPLSPLTIRLTAGGFRPVSHGTSGTYPLLRAILGLAQNLHWSWLSGCPNPNVTR
jgi:hypothetical protein